MTAIRGRRSNILLVAVLLALLAGVAVLISQKVGRSSSGQPEIVISGKDAHHFDSVSDMTTTADLAVKAKVSAVGEGPVEGKDVPVRYRAITLDVLKVLAPANAPPIKTVTFYEMGWDVNSGKGMVREGLTWTETGDVGYFFLTELDNGNYALTNSQSRVLVRGNFLVPSSSDAPLAQAVAKISSSALEQQVVTAAKDEASGLLKPQVTS